MDKRARVTAAVRRGGAWLLPAGRRDWVAAVWAEAREVPPGLTRLAWRAGGVWMLAQEALMPRRLGRALLFAAVAAATAWVTWPQPWAGHIAEGRFDASAPYRTEIYAGTNVFGYLLIWMSFPVIGLIAGATVASVFADSAPPEPSPAAIPGLPM